MQKNFDQWNELKKNLEKNKKTVFFKEREIWWVNVGINIGDEECGKGKRSVRPVLIIKKFNNHFFFGIPLSTKQKKDNKYYFNFTFKSMKQAAIMCQAKVFSTKRLCDMNGKIGKEIFESIRRKTGKLLNLS